MNDFPEGKILLIDDERTARYGMRKALALLGADIQEAADGEEGWRRIVDFRPDVAVCDVNMPRMNGLELLHRLSELPASERPLVIVITAYGSEKVAVQAMKAGAYDYISKPYDIDELRITVSKALEKVCLEKENRRLRQQVGGSPLLGNSAAMQRVRRLIEKAAPTDVTILLTGPTGAGKELAARTIHALSSRSSGPFVTMNCAAIPRDLVESELFGHEKGAFTGAGAQRQGKFELAHGGTLFLDEIADMSLETQAKILRVLEDKTFTRLGGKESITADVRLISATNKDLEKEMEQGSFRADLYYRLKVFEISLPTLAERREDIPLLVDHYIRHFAERHRRPVRGIEPAAMRMLIEYDWPGNVRELIHVIEQSLVLAEGDLITAADLPAELLLAADDRTPLPLGESSLSELKERYVEKFERRLILSALAQSGGNISAAARLLKIKRQNLQLKMKTLGIAAEKTRRP